ncbi:hypothetical protein CBR_g19431 [Chara braunii]|uniref:Integrase catalytic domain-containing protein n=1 Tax=Chara braunii TaxID=69332 RepID=A0A388KXY7_CHABU|nr:hypothetical protein CBR_g19431 [Chara braunii]|eukprot:GBG74917.1 hypothetical protein CBR_g19431 [Chara braunii]
MATGDEAGSQLRDENQDVEDDVDQEERDLRDRGSAKSLGDRERSKDAVPGEDSGKSGGSKRGTPGTKEVSDRESPARQQPEGAEPKKVRLTDARRKLAEVERRMAEYRAKLLEEIMNDAEKNVADDRTWEEGELDLGQGSQDGDAQHRKDRPRDTRNTPTRKGKEGIESLREDRDRPVNPPLLDSGASRPSASPVSAKGCEGLWSLRERVLGWFDPEGVAKPRGKLDFSKEGAGPSSATRPGMIEGGLRKVVSSLTRALSKNQGYLADAKKKLTFDGGNITKFLIDYENLAALLRWTEEEKMEHLGQHVPLNLGRDIMAIVATSGSWKEARDVMVRKYLADEKMATDAELATVQRKNFATYSDFLREFTLVALRILGVTDRIMSKYFLKQFTEFDKDKILSAYQQTAKFLNTRDVDFSTITDIAEKMVVTDSLGLLKDGEIIDLTGKTGDKVKKGIESLHKRVHGVDGKIERVENALLVMQTQVSQTQAVGPPLPPQEAIVPPGIANRGNNRKDPAKEQCKYCTIVGHFVRMCPRLYHDIILKQCFRTLRGEILGPRGERVNGNSLGGMRRAVIVLNNLDAVAVEAEPVNFITESDDRDGVNVTTKQRGATKKVIQDAVMKDAQEGSNPPADSDQDKVYGKPREEAPVDKVTSAKKKFRYQIPILADPEIDHTLSQLLGTMVSVSFQTMLQASPRLLKGLSQLLTRQRVEVAEEPDVREEGKEEEPPREVANLHRAPGDLEDLKKAFADIRLSLPDREGGEVMRTPPGTKLSFHALPVGKLKVQIDTHHTDALVDGGAEITLIRKDFATIVGCPINREVTGSVRGAGEVTELLRAKMDSFVAEPTASPYANKWFVFRKPNKSLRWIQDLQKLNAVTIRDAGSLPQADLLAESHAGHNIYSLIDLYSGYDQLQLDARDRPYTAMHTPLGQLQMQVTPMGFTNAVAEAHRRMLAVAGDMFPDKCEPYIDDNPVKGAREKDETEVQPGIRKFVWDHLQDIRELLRRFLEYNITASGPKSILAVPEVTILGFHCGAYGRKPDPAKTDKIAHWTTPLRTTTEVRAFLGVVGFWRIFIKGFAKIAEPIRAMIREEGTLDWTEERESAVQTLKNILTSEEFTLAAPCFNDEVGRPFILETDGGPMAVGGVLIQKGEDGRERPIRFESRTLNSAERRYSQFKKEVGFIGQFDSKIEHIDDLRDRADGLSRVALTPEGLEEAEPIDAFLDYEGGTLVVDSEMVGTTCTTGELLIKALEKGPPAVVAELREGTVTRVGRREEKDAWGSVRKPRDEQIALAVEGGWRRVMSMMESQELEMQHYQAYQVDNNRTGTQEEEQFFLIKLYEGLFREIGLLLVGNKEPREVSPKAREEADRYVLRRGHLFRKEEGLTPMRVVCGRMRQLDIIQAMHDGLAGGHRSSKGTLAKITPLYYWSGMASMVATYCQTCKICQERSTVRIFEPLRPTRVLGPEHMVHLDLAVMPVSRKGYRYILDARDNLSGFVEATALKKKTGFAVAHWVEDFYLRHPFIRRFIADNGTEFVNQDVLNTCKRLGVPIKLTEPYHPEANAPVERGHQRLKNTIAKLAADDLGNWPDYLRHAVFAENMTPKRTTGCIPAKLWYGREIDFPVEALVPTWNKLEDDPHLTTEQLIEARCEQAARNEEALEEIAHKVLDSRMKDKTRWDQLKNIRKEPLQVGEMVLVRNSALETTWSGQLGRRFKGPYRIARKLDVSTFEIENLDGITIRGPVPAQRLVRFLTRDPVEQWLQEAQDKEAED